MTREQCKQFISTTFGIELDKVTDEQITAYLNNVNGAIKAEKDKADLYKSDAELAKELQAKLDAIEAEKLSDIEKANNETSKANKKVEELESQIKKMQVRTKLAELGITGDQADNFFTQNGEINFEILSQVISDREKQASDLKEKEILKGTPNPGGNAGGDGETDGMKFAKSLGEKIAKDNKVTSDVLSHYAAI